YEQFPVVLEAMRECLQDVYDVPGLREVLTDIAAHRVRVLEIETPAPSPFARSLLFGYVGMFLYEPDTPLAERRAAALALDSTLLAELLGGEAIRELLDAEALTQIESDLQRLTPSRHARDIEGAADLLRFLGDLSTTEAARRGVDPGWLDGLAAQRRAIAVRIAGEQRWIAIEDSGKMRDALGVALPVGIPEAFTELSPDPLGELLIRYARCRGPFPAASPARRFGLGVAVVTGALERLTATGRLVRGELRPLALQDDPADIASVEYCDAAVLRRLRRASLAKLRAEVEPVEQAALGRFLPYWHGIVGYRSAGRANSARPSRPASAEDVFAVIEQLAGAPLAASAVESLILPARLPGYSTALLDELTASGEVTWTGCGALGKADGWISFAPTDLAALLLGDPEPSAPQEPLHRAVLSALEGGALFFRQIVDGVSGSLREQGEQATSDEAVVGALWDLLWAGLLTNDTLAPLRTLLGAGGGTHRARRGPPRARYGRMRGSGRAMPSRLGPPSVAGRWSTVMGRARDPTLRAHARTEALLQRHGVLTRGALEGERVTGGFSGIYRVLRAMEESGQVIRGYVVSGLGAAQFAARGAVDELRSRSTVDESAEPQALVLAATDPAQPYGAALSWPDTIGESKHLPGRKAGALTVLVDGTPVLYLERGGRSLLSFSTDPRQLAVAASALAETVRSGRLAQLTVRRADGASAHSSAVAHILSEAGFRATPQGFRLRA
ncbi:MAG: Lhr family helicase, partial [Sciscionella sp.]